MSKPTPEPWEIVERSDTLNVKPVGQAAKAICRIQRTMAPYRANARLIAAAPELLEAAKMAMEDDDLVAYEALRAAIAKATGEEPS